jgi:Icc-related predicted phosphoesterase
MKWTPLQEKALTTLVEKHLANGGTENAAIIKSANDMGISYTAAYQKFQKIKHDYSAVPDSRHQAQQPLTFDGPSLALGDLQIPFHNAPFVNRCIRKAHSMGIRTVVLGGDIVELASLSAWPEDFTGPKATVSDAKFDELMELANNLPEEHAAKLREKLADTQPDNTLTEEINSARRVIRAILENFDKVYALMGNHEHRAVRKLEQAINVQDLGGFFFDNNPKVQITPNYFIQSTCNGIPWRFTHPINTAKDSSSKKLAPKFQSNTIMFHNHHFSVRTEISGRFIGVEPGMCCDEQKMGYPVNRDNGADMHVTGAAIIDHDGRLVLINDWM